MADDKAVAEVYAKKGAKVADLDEATVERWRAIARETAWKDYAGKTPFVGGIAQARRGRAVRIAASKGADTCSMGLKRSPAKGRRFDPAAIRMARCRTGNGDELAERRTMAEPIWMIGPSRPTSSRCRSRR